MAMNRVLATLLLLSCLCASICALRFSVRPRGCSDQYRSCSNYHSNGYCNLPTYKSWMKKYCAQTCGFCTGTTEWFQIHSSGYSKCLTASYVTRRVRIYINGNTPTNRYYTTSRVSLSLSDCVRRSTGQSWRWTSGGQLQLALKQECLAVTSVWTGYKGRTYGVSMQKCNSPTSYKQWVCTAGGYLKLKNINLYLVPVLYSGRVGGVRVRSSVTSRCLWTRYGTSKSLCANATQTTPTPTQTTPTPSTQITTIAPQSPWFQIKSTAYNKCVALRDKSKLPRQWAPSLTLETCNKNSPRQLWQLTSDGQLKLNHNGNCLISNVYNVPLFRPCTMINRNQKWSCVQNKFRWGTRAYLTSWVYSRQPLGYIVRTTRSCRRNSCDWSRSGTGLSVCDKATQTTPTPAQTTPTPSTQITTIAPQSPWFQMKSTANNKCVALRDKSKLPRWYQWASTLTLEICDRNSPRQLWQWTSDGQLKLNHNGNCLISNVYNVPRFQSCTTINRNQQWSCVQNKFRWGTRAYLTSWMYSGLPLGYSVRTTRSCRRNSCDWSRSGTGLSICDNGKATTTKAPTTTQMTTPATTNPPTTTTTPPTTTTTPPVPPTDDVGTPPLPPTGTLKPPPIPGNTPPPIPGNTPPPIPGNTPPPIPGNTPPPIPGNTPPVPPFPGNTPPIVTTTKPPPPQGNKNIRCGTKGRIGGVVNGTAAAAGSWPWQVGIKTCAHCNITCGGTLINDEWVVTAAHCVSGRFAEELYLVIGEVDQSRKSGHEQRFKGSEIISHEDYGIDEPYDKDIALIRLDKYAVFNDHVRPLCMPGKGTVLTDKDLCTVTGFGRVTQSSAKSAKLLQANVKIVALNTCVKSYADLLPPRKVTTNMLCAGYKRGGTDACQGDSGGPLTCFERRNFRFILGGVVSWGIGCARPDLYGVYTNTALFTPWVQKKVAAYGY